MRLLIWVLLRPLFFSVLKTYLLFKCRATHRRILFKILKHVSMPTIKVHKLLKDIEQNTSEKKNPSLYLLEEIIKGVVIATDCHLCMILFVLC